MFKKTKSSIKSMGEITQIWEYEITEGQFTHFDDCICILLNLKYELFQNNPGNWKHSVLTLKSKEINFDIMKMKDNDSGLLVFVRRLDTHIRQF